MGIIAILTFIGKYPFACWIACPTSCAATDTAAIVSPSNATNKKVIWTSSNPNVATVDNYGNVNANDKWNGETIITATTEDGKYTASYTLIVKQKVIVVITASAGVRMNDWVKKYFSAKEYYYNINDKTLFYQFESGQGFEYQYGEGLNLAINNFFNI